MLKGPPCLAVVCAHVVPRGVHTEFSARHAKKVITTGVVLERKASISSIPVGLKNKVCPWEGVLLVSSSDYSGLANPVPIRARIGLVRGFVVEVFSPPTTPGVPAFQDWVTRARPG